MDIGSIISLVLVGIMVVVIVGIAIQMDRKYIVRERGKVNYKKTQVYLRWNVFDTLTLILAIYAVVCVQVLNVLIITGESIENNYVQFFLNQGQVWTTISIIYLVVRVTNTLKCIKSRIGDQSV
ncbi:group-specific protein [Jeotgalibacillus sp. S-D1]|uniref:group-specific protein n=1 Tax=Jeotgalibacillus sp. S-D1 TaxID=2552189 RepID=UPI0010595479|nr:group-specific protein [Jeotgalibacillus sp. S-D1]TDL31300.1 group-specific protein [Jeotgalibacillus sp. S-D1]